jgi:signal transduction histidine kinase
MAELRPSMLDDDGLLAALQWYAMDFSRRTGIQICVPAAEPDARPPPQVEIALFRIAQEALNNVAKHAPGSRVAIDLRQEGREYVMRITDDGGGRPADPPLPQRGGRVPLGLITMRERAEGVGGRFEVTALPGGGTRVTVRIPW